jgi:hypothetical protein
MNMFEMINKTIVKTIALEFIKIQKSTDKGFCIFIKLKSFGFC